MSLMETNPKPTSQERIATAAADNGWQVWSRPWIGERWWRTELGAITEYRKGTRHIVVYCAIRQSQAGLARIRSRQGDAGAGPSRR